MQQPPFPSGWDEARIQQVISHYENQSEEEAVREDEAAFGPSETVITVPVDLVPKIRELIARRKI